MKLFNGKGGMIAKITAVVGVVSAILFLYWNIGDRVQAKIDTSITFSETKTENKIVIIENKFVSSLDKFQRQQDIRYWMQLRDQAKIELDRIRRGLGHHPNDPALISDKAYWQEVYNKASRELDKILNP